MPLKLPRLPANQQLINADGTPTIVFSRWWQSMAEQIEASINGIQAALDAAAAANAAAANANAAADTAQTAADDAAAAAAAAAADQALINSYITPDSVLTTTTTTITIAAHTRHYADSTSVAVSGGTIAATAALDVDYIFYNDPARAGGTVTYQVSTVSPTQTGSTHVVGAITIPSTGTGTGGTGPRKPGFVDP